MGKGSRKRRYAQICRANAKKEAEKQRKKTRARRIVTVGICCILTLAAAGCGGFYAIKTVLENRGTLMRRTAVIESDGCTVNESMMTYFTYDAYKTFSAENSDSLDSIGLDAGTDIKEQSYDGDETWFDYFYSQAIETVQKNVALYNAAVSSGLKLSDTDTADIEDELAGMDISEYGRGVNADDIRDCLEIICLAEKYYDSAKEQFEPDDAETEEYFNNNSQYFKTFYYASYSLYTDSFESEDAYAEWRDKITESGSLEDFKANISQCLISGCGISEEEAQTEIASITPISAEYSEDSSVSNWAFDGERGLYDTFYEESDGVNTIYMIISLPERDEETSVNARHILLTAEGCGSTAKAKKKAQEIYDEYLSGEMTADSFSALAEKYSEDAASAENGGLCQNIYRGQTAEEFEEWCFDSSRAVGNTAIVKASDGYHIIYFEGEGLLRWQFDVAEKITEEKYSDFCDGLIDSYNVKLSEK